MKSFHLGVLYYSGARDMVKIKIKMVWLVTIMIAVSRGEGVPRQLRSPIPSLASCTLVIVRRFNLSILCFIGAVMQYGGLKNSYMQ